MIKTLICEASFKKLSKSICVILSALLVFTFICADTSPIAAGGAIPYIAVDDAPPIEGGTHVGGYIWLDGAQGGGSAAAAGSFDGYAITMALEVDRGGTVWGPKPTGATPSVSVGSDGRFSCLFVSGGLDYYAERLYVYLIPSGFVPNSDVERTAAAALDTVTIDRYSDGRVTINHTKTPPVSNAQTPAGGGGTTPGGTTPGGAAPGGAPAVGGGGAMSGGATPSLTPASPPSKQFMQQKNPTGTPKLSICYSPYTNGLSPETNSAVPMEQMLWQLNLIYPYADTIRLFGVSGELEKIYKPAKEDYKFRIIAGCWIDSRYSETQIYAELDKLIEMANAGYVDVAVVGSETVARGDFPVGTLIDYIEYVRSGINDKNVPVGTSDVPDVFLLYPKLVESCDVILCTIYPFFVNITSDKAAQNLAETYGRVKAAAMGRQVIISESGWPTEGSPEGASVPGMKNARELFVGTYAWARENDVEIVFFSEIDEAWKVEGMGGDVGGHWGHFTSVGMLKDAYLDTYRSISPVPVLDAAAVEWAEEAIAELVTLGVLNAGGPSLYEPLLPITRGDFIHYLAKALSLETITGRVGTTFADVDPNIYYYFTMGAGQKAGLVMGVGGNRCEPMSDITRQDMFTLIYRALSYAGMDLAAGAGSGANGAADLAALDRFADRGAVADYAKEAISALARNSLVMGDHNSNVNPQSNASRAEAAVLLYRVYKFANGIS
ncbi:MAG: S-layer homology domain-containing protein [Oscillospiraceae bacterium]|nr:S-layer homology domain-containing protein [Oscillospiraceae bacterium]